MTALMTEAPTETRDEQIARHQGLVATIAFSFRGRGIDIEDLKQSGNLGLMRAIDDFDPARGFKFATYARHWIASEIRREIATNSRRVRIPEWAWDFVGQYRRAAKALAADAGGEEPTPEAVLDAIEAPANRRDAILVAVEEAARGEVGAAVAALIPDDSGPSPLDAAVAAEQSGLLRAALETLAPDARRLIEVRYGLGDEGPMKPHAACCHLGLTHRHEASLHDESITKLWVAMGAAS